MFDVAIVGCGVVGAATAFMLSQRQCSVVVLEKENDIATGATRANSAIIHAGYDPEPNTIMARLNVRGVELAKQLTKQLDVSYLPIGSLVLAFNEEDEATVQKLYERGVQNGVPGLEIISGDEARKREPHLSEQVTMALWAPSAGIINPWEYALAMIETAVVNGVELRRSSGVTAIERMEGGYRLHTASGVVEARSVVNAAGVNSGKIHEMVADAAFEIRPNRGEYYLMDKSDGSRANCVLFQCPGKAGKGVLVSPTVGGNLIVGPSADAAEDGSRVATTADGLELVREKALLTMPDLPFRGTIRTFAGMRANSNQEDFYIRAAAPCFIDLACIKSPGLSAAPAIAEEAVRLLEQEGLELPQRENCTTTRRQIRFNALSVEEKQKVVAENPLYGRVICRCETITEGEIVAALHSPVPPVSIDGVKRRCGAGLGRCQGGFCGPRVAEILARELNIPMGSVLKDTAGTEILTDETKQPRKNA